MKELIEAMSIPAVLVDDTARIAALNSPARHLFGPGIEGRHYITALRQPPLLDAIEQVQRTRAPANTRYLASDTRGDVTYEVSVAPVQPNKDDISGQVALLVCFEDRTAKEEANQMRRDFVANVSHELRTPLTAVLGFIETLRGAAKDDEKARDRFLSIMEGEASRMNRLVNDLLSLGRVEADERIRPTTPVDLAAVVANVVSTLAPLIQDQDTRLETYGLDQSVTLPGDADQLAQVATNLLENAVKYAGHGRSVTLRLTTEAAHPLLRGDAVILSVQDEGEGIDRVHIPRLTERFYRIDSHRSRELGGTGLGLAIVKHIVNRHRGRLQIESTPGEGSVFTVVLPLNA